MIKNLKQDVADMIKFAAYTCPPDPRSGLCPLELIPPVEASAFLSFLVLFLGTSGLVLRCIYLNTSLEMIQS